MAGLRKEVWLKEFIKDFWPQSTFLDAAEDVSQFVDNEKLNLAESGADPEVLLDNTAFPIGIDEITDTAKEVLLRTMDTKNTVIRDIEQAARSQNLRKAAMDAHKRNMRLALLEIAAHSYALSTTDAGKGNVLVPATGAERAGQGVKAITFEDIYSVGEVFDEFDIPVELRNMVLDIKHLNDLKKQDLKEFKLLIQEINEGKMSGMFGMKFHRYSRNPYFDITDESKLAYGGAPTGDHQRASIAFVSTEVLKATGSTKMYSRIADPEARGDILGFGQRFIAIPKRDKFRVALLSKASGV